MHSREFVELDSDGNVKATLTSERCPGPDPDVVPDGMLEVTAQSPRDWHRYRWDGSAFVERDDLPESVATETTEDRLTNIENMLQQLLEGQG